MSGNNQSIWVNETISLLSLNSIRGIGYWSLVKLAKSNLSFKEILSIDSSSEFEEELKKAGCRISSDFISNWPQNREEIWALGNSEFHKLQANNIKVLHSKQPEFPKSLNIIPNSPKWLFVQGNESILHGKSIAMVGTRNPSPDGKFLANYIGACLPFFNSFTVSGLANGIDQIIHKSSIRFNVPTIAFLGTGIDTEFPAGTFSLRKEICESGGAIVTEYLPGQSYSKENFIRRNRLQAGLADLVIPIAWKAQSGTAHTVNYASKYKKKIIALKMPDWPDQREELALARRLNGSVFTIPGDEQKLFDTIESLLNNPVPIQKPLFDMNQD